MTPLLHDWLVSYLQEGERIIRLSYISPLGSVGSIVRRLLGGNLHLGLLYIVSRYPSQAPATGPA